MKETSNKIQYPLSKGHDLSFEEAKSIFGDDYTLEDYYYDYPDKDPLARYVQQLKGDLEEMREAGPPDHLFEEDVIVDFQDQEMPDADIDSGFATKDMTFEEIFGLEKVIFPPPEKLNLNFIWDLSYTLEFLLGSYDIMIVLPKGYSDELLYYWLWEVWDNKKIPYGSLGTIIEVNENELPPQML